MLKLVMKVNLPRCFLCLAILSMFMCTLAFLFQYSPYTGEVSRLIVRLPLEKRINYVIFDASGYNGKLEFLNHREDGWHVLVVNLAQENLSTRCEFCSFLTNDMVKAVFEQLNYQIDEGEIDNKGMTLLAAIMLVSSREAPWIYVTNRAVPIPYNAFERVTKKKVKSGLVYQGPVLEPCSHFMDPFKWNGLGIHPIGNHFNLREVSPNSVYYVLNECFRKGMSQQSWEKSLDTRAPIPYTMPGTFVAVDFKNVLVSKRNVWTLIASVLPDDKGNTTAWSRSQIVSLMVQRVLWETRSNFGVLPDMHNIGKGCPTCDLQAHLDHSGKEILANLIRWRCGNFETVHKCLLKLSTLDEIIPNLQIRHLVSFWITILERYGWQPLERIVLNDGRLREKTTGRAVHFTPAKSLHKSPTDDTRPPNAYRQLCNIADKPYVGKIPAQHKNEDILLIVIFNFAKFMEHIPMLEYTHGRYFKHIIYCSEKFDIFAPKFQNQFNVNPVSFIATYTLEGVFGHNCMAVVMEMGYEVKGYLQASDDVLINTWNYPSLPYEKPWFQAKLRVLDITADQVPSVWIHHNNWAIWYSRMAETTRKVFKRIQQAASHPINGPMVSRFLMNIANITGCDNCLIYETADIVYVPRRLVSNFLYFIDFFSAVHLEITFPTILVGISSDSEIFRLRGNYLWYEERVLYPYVWTEFNHFHHPFKLFTANQTKGVNFFCQKFLARLDKDIIT